MTSRELMQLAVQEGKRSRTEDARQNPTPAVGAVLAVDGEVIASGYRGKTGNGEHAEFGILKDLDTVPAGAVLYTTLEPCTLRGPGKTPCARWIFKRGIKRVVIGLIDPNRKIQGDGFWLLQENGINVSFFDSDLISEIATDNQAFITFYRPQGWLPPPPLRSLDDWYFIINAIYLDKNYHRDPTMLFSHLVEVLGGLSLLATGKKKPDVSPQLFFPKSLAWWFALCGSVGVRSIEEVLFLKFPSVCPYCHRQPHNNRLCAQAKRENRNPDWQRLRALADENRGLRPRSIGDWKKMFDSIYPTSQAETYEVVFGRLSEELGELAECIRVLDLTPNSFLSEATDVFAWLMKLTNLFEMKENSELDLSQLLYQRYPDRCKDCGNVVCSCRPFLPHTLRRIAHDGPPTNVLSAAQALLSHAERADQFDLGSKSIAIGDIVLDSTPDLFRAVYDVVRDLPDQFRKIPQMSPDLVLKTEAWSQQMSNLLASQRVSQRVVDDFLLLVRSTNRQVRTLLLEGLSRLTPNEFQRSLYRFIETAPLSLTEEET